MTASRGDIGDLHTATTHELNTAIASTVHEMNVLIDSSLSLREVERQFRQLQNRIDRYTAELQAFTSRACVARDKYVALIGEIKSGKAHKCLNRMYTRLERQHRIEATFNGGVVPPVHEWLIPPACSVKEPMEPKGPVFVQKRRRVFSKHCKSLKYYHARKHLSAYGAASHLERLSKALDSLRQQDKLVQHQLSHTKEQVKIKEASLAALRRDLIVDTPRFIYEDARLTYEAAVREFLVKIHTGTTHGSNRWKEKKHRALVPMLFGHSASHMCSIKNEPEVEKYNTWGPSSRETVTMPPRVPDTLRLLFGANGDSSENTTLTASPSSTLSRKTPQLSPLAMRQLVDLSAMWAVTDTDSISTEKHTSTGKILDNTGGKSHVTPPQYKRSHSMT